MLRGVPLLSCLVLFSCGDDAADLPSDADVGIEPADAGGEPEAGQTLVSVDTPVDVGGIPSDAMVTDSGLASRVLDPGTGTEHPTASSQVTVHYSGWTTDGVLFDSSVSRKRPATFSLSRVIPGWTEGLQLMVVGERRRFWIPGELAYDNSPGADAPRGMLVFDVQLLEIE